MIAMALDRQTKTALNACRPSGDVEGCRSPAERATATREGLEIVGSRPATHSEDCRGAQPYCGSPGIAFGDQSGNVPGARVEMTGARSLGSTGPTSRHGVSHGFCDGASGALPWLNHFAS